MKHKYKKNQSYRVVEGNIASGLILLCDHATAWLPEKYDSLGMGEDQFVRHIAYDIGAEALTRGLAKRLGAPAIMTSFSRLLIDPNRGTDDPTLIMKLSDGAIINGNRHIDSKETAFRIDTYHRPYHQAINSMIECFLGEGVVPVIFSIHSFTDKWKGVARPWHAAILWDNDARLVQALLLEFAKQKDIIVGDNEPYDGALGNDTMYTHCSRRGLAHALLEVRQDLVGNEPGVVEWVDRTARVLEPALQLPQMHEIIYHGSRTGPVKPVETIRAEAG